MASIVSQQGAVNAASGTAQTIVPSGITPGNTLVVVAGNAGGGATGTITGCADTGGNSYTLPDPPNGGIAGVGNTKLGVAYVHDCVDPGTITVTTGNIGSRKILLLEIEGLENTPADAAAEDFTNTAFLESVAPAIDLTAAGLAIALVSCGGTADPTAWTADWTHSQTGLPDNTTQILRAAWQEFAAAGSTGTCGFTFAASRKAGLGMIGFKVVAAGAVSVETIGSVPI